MSLQGTTHHSCSPAWLVRSLWRNRSLTLQLIRREVVGRSRGSVMGLLWSFLHPVLMLAVYTFVFSVVFKARWGGSSESQAQFALTLFAGLLVFNLFSECVTRSPTLITSNINYVKKVIFPLEILPVVALGSAAFHFFVSLSVWLLFYVAFHGLPPSTFLLVPLAALPLFVMTLGCAWFLSALGVYLRDVTQGVAVVMPVLMFMSPVFYPLSALPDGIRGVVSAVPLNVIIEEFRNAMIWGHGIDWPACGAVTAGCMLVAFLGFAWFQKTRRGFADVL